MVKKDENGWNFYDSLGEIIKDGYTPIKVWNTIQFFQLEGWKTILAKNIYPYGGQLVYDMWKQNKFDFGLLVVYLCTEMPRSIHRS